MPAERHDPVGECAAGDRGCRRPACRTRSGRRARRPHAVRQATPCRCPAAGRSPRAKAAVRDHRRPAAASRPWQAAGSAPPGRCRTRRAAAARPDPRRRDRNRSPSSVPCRMEVKEGRRRSRREPTHKYATHASAFPARTRSPRACLADGVPKTLTSQPSTLPIRNSLLIRFGFGRGQGGSGPFWRFELVANRRALAFVHLTK